jgi:hypothetical protein
MARTKKDRFALKTKQIRKIINAGVVEKQSQISFIAQRLETHDAVKQMGRKFLCDKSSVGSNREDRLISRNTPRTQWNETGLRGSDKHQTPRKIGLRNFPICTT